MPLTQLRIENFQSHRLTDIRLGRLTVIVGPSSSGKSAVTRALKLVANNARGVSYVRHGAESARVSVVNASHFADPVDAAYQVSVERSQSKSIYTLQFPGDDEVHTFTKCGTSIPDTVSLALDFGEGDLWLAGQFDRPYLLDQTGGHVARVLSELTNVSLIFASVRELNSRALNEKRAASTRTSDLDSVTEQVRQYSDLPDQLRACELAESSLKSALALEERRERLVSVRDAVLDASARAQAARDAVRPVPDSCGLDGFLDKRTRLSGLVDELRFARDRVEALPSFTVPDTEKLDFLRQNCVAFRSGLEEVQRVGLRVAEATCREEQILQEFNLASQDLVNVVAEAGSCPVCGASAEHARLDHVEH